jgi:hypothetical protein
MFPESVADGLQVEILNEPEYLRKRR